MKKLGLLIGLCCSFGLVNGQTNTVHGTGAGNAIVTGNGGIGTIENTFIGYNSGYNTVAAYNTGIGSNTLKNNTEGMLNVAVGNNSMKNNTVGLRNSALGYSALEKNTTGNHNVSIGFYAMGSNTTGVENTGIGCYSLDANTTGYKNTSVGYASMTSNQTGYYNTSLGYQAMYYNTGGTYNTSNGAFSLFNNTTGDKNTAMGNNAATANTTGKNLTAIGYDALRYNTTGTGNTAIGYKAGPGSAGSTYLYSSGLGAYAVPTASYQVRVGHFGITSIGGAQNWTNLSDGRFKKEVEEDVMGLDFIKALRPVSYYVDNAAVNKFLGVELEDEAINNKKQYQTGFIAQEVEATAKELGFEHFGGVDAPANDNSHYGLRYAEFVVPLVKSVQELSAQNERQTTTIEDLKTLIAAQQVQINDLLESKNTNLNTATISTQSKAVLYQNAPNPFTHETQIKLFVPEEVEQAFIQVCTIDGKQLFVKEVTARNETSVMLEGSNLSAGIYMYTLVVDNEVVASRRMVLTE